MSVFLIMVFFAFFMLISFTFSVLTSPLFWILILSLVAIVLVVDKKNSANSIGNNRNQNIKVEYEGIKENDMNIKSEKERKQLKAQTELEFMNAAVLSTIDADEFEKYFSQQLNNLDIRNNLIDKPESFGLNVIVYKDKNYALQVNLYNNVDIGPLKVQKVFAGATTYGSIKPVILTTGSFSEEAIAMAKNLDVELISGKDVNEWHNNYYKREHNHVEKGLYKDIQKHLKNSVGEYIKD